MKVNKTFFGGVNAANAARAPLPLAGADIVARLEAAGRALDERLRERRGCAIIGDEQKEGQGHVATSTSSNASSPHCESEA